MYLLHTLRSGLDVSMTNKNFALHALREIVILPRLAHQASCRHTNRAHIKFLPCYLQRQKAHDNDLSQAGEW